MDVQSTSWFRKLSTASCRLHRAVVFSADTFRRGAALTQLKVRQHTPTTCFATHIDAAKRRIVWINDQPMRIGLSRVKAMIFCLEFSVPLLTIVELYGKMDQTICDSNSITIVCSRKKMRHRNYENSLRQKWCYVDDISNFRKKIVIYFTTKKIMWIVS